MDLYSRLMNIDEAIEYLNEKTNRDFNKDKILKFINEKKIPIVFDYEGRGTWEFRAESGWKSYHIQVKGYFNFRNRNDAVQLFKGFLEEIDLEEAIIYKLKTARVLKNVSDGIKPKKGDDILFETGESSTISSNPFNTSDSQNSIKIDNSKVGVLKEDLEEYLNKVQTEYMNSKTKIEALESKIEKLETENARLIQQLTQTKAELATKPTSKEASSRSQDQKLIAMMAILLAKKCRVFQVGDKPNATQINEAILDLARQELKIIDDDMFGLKGNTAKISSAINEYLHIIKNKPEE